jgi:hypothetical protein
MRLMLLNDGIDIIAIENSRYDFVIAIAEGKLSIANNQNWIHQNIKSNAV